MARLLAGIPLGEVSTSMTINAPAALLLLCYELAADEQGVPGDALRGTVQNDVLKEYVARGNYIFPPRPSMRLTIDLFAYCAERIPHWNTISISGYHIREAGLTAAQELAFTLANGIAYCEAAVAAGLSPDSFGERLSFFFNAHNDVLQEVAKFARRGVCGPASWASASLRPARRRRRSASTPRPAARRSRPSSPRTTSCASPCRRSSAIYGGAQSVHTNGFDEALALPTERAATLALRTQQILMYEAGTTDTADPLGGSWYVESLTDELEVRAGELIGRIDELGGAVAAIEAGWVQQQIEESAFRWQREVETGERVIVGVNRFTATSRTPSSSITSTPRSNAHSAPGPRRCAPPAMPRRSRERWPRCGEWRTPARTSFPCFARPRRARHDR